MDVNEFGGLIIKGFKAAGISAGIKKNGKKDFALIVSEAPCAIAGVFTKNSVKAAPVMIDMERVRKGSSRGVVVNSGNANACTGKRGHKDALDILTAVERELSLEKGDLLISSTGVIGDFLPKEKMLGAVPRLVKSLDVRGWVSTTEAIRTTDTEAYLKMSYGSKNIGGSKTSILGIAKGAGMICPDMATMLSFFATDANIKAATLKKALKEAVGLSFNRISVDNDASTNDTVLVFANKMSKGREITYATKDYRAFTRLLAELSLKLAKMIVRDGEGATKLIEIRIKGARSDKDA
ncbi:MAG: bifunctional ornithine acetyltransferase/N-acetylglutamate synthase, partial [Deltaproteobacteria bacterium]